MLAALEELGDQTTASRLAEAVLRLRSGDDALPVDLTAYTVSYTHLEPSDVQVRAIGQIPKHAACGHLARLPWLIIDGTASA